MDSQAAQSKATFLPPGIFLTPGLLQQQAYHRAPEAHAPDSSLNPGFHIEVKGSWMRYLPLWGLMSCLENGDVTNARVQAGGALIAVEEPELREGAGVDFGPVVRRLAGPKCELG